jgi:hypothetical protein
MKIYVAGKFEDKEKVREIFSKLKIFGHSISYDWTGHKPIKPYRENKELASQYSENEISGIKDSDIFIYLPNKDSHTLHMELGSALMSNKIKGKPEIYIVGEWDFSPWIFNPRIIHFNDIEEVLEKLKSESL